LYNTKSNQFAKAKTGKPILSFRLETKLKSIPLSDNKWYMIVMGEMVLFCPSGRGRVRERESERHTAGWIDTRFRVRAEREVFKTT
jgi:hypothetical protein